MDLKPFKFKVETYNCFKDLEGLKMEFATNEERWAAMQAIKHTINLLTPGGIESACGASNTWLSIDIDENRCIELVANEKW